MSKRKIILTATRTYSKTISFEVEVDENITDDKLIDYLSQDNEINETFEERIYQASLSLDETTYEFQDPTNKFGGTL
jgi:hypothetical protein